MGTNPGPLIISSPNIGNITSVQVAPANPTRQNLYIFNLGPNVIWVSPITTTTGTHVVAAAGVQGSVPLTPNTGNFFPGFTTGMHAIAAAGVSNALTVWEYFST